MNSVRKVLGNLTLPLMLALVAVSPTFGQVGPATDEGRVILGRPGYLVIEGVRDTTDIFSWQRGPGPGRHSLVWSTGTLSLPDTLYLDEFGAVDAGVVCQAELSGVGGSGRLVFEDGLYRVSEPLVLSDGVLELHVSGGELEVRGDQIRYRQTRLQNDKTKANYIFLAGLILLIIVLMRRARVQMKKSRAQIRPRK